MLREWGEWIGADLVLTNLPSTFDGKYFSTATHLNAEGRQIYTKLVEEEFRRGFPGIVETGGKGLESGSKSSGAVKVRAREL